MFDNNLSIDGLGEADPQTLEELQKSIVSKSQSELFLSSGNCEHLVKMAVFYKLSSIIVKVTVRVMRYFGVSKLAMFTRFRYDTSSFLANNQQEVDERHTIEKEWKRAALSLEKLKERLSFELSKVNDRTGGR